MSIHLMVVAAYLPAEVVTQGQKLVLMKIADSADDESRMGRPGLHRLAAWPGVTEKRAISIVTELVALGLVERVETGRPGRAAVYRVFPLGVPPMPSTEQLKARQAAARVRPKNPNKARPARKRAKPSPPAKNARDIEERDGLHRRNPTDGTQRVPPVEPSGLHAWNPAGSTGATPSFPSPSSPRPDPPTPEVETSGGPRHQENPASGGCPRHTTPHARCRGCGTNPRSRRRTAEREAERDRRERWWSQWYAERAQAADPEDETVDAAKALAREGIRRSSTGRRARGGDRAQPSQPPQDGIK